MTLLLAKRGPNAIVPFSYKNKDHLFKKTHVYRTISDFLCLSLKLSVYADQSYRVTYCRWKGKEIY